jgi:hypothetical protein
MKLKNVFSVIPAKVPPQARDPESFDIAQDLEALEGLVERAGIQENKRFWTPALAGVTALVVSSDTV